MLEVNFYSNLLLYFQLPWICFIGCDAFGFILLSETILSQAYAGVRLQDNFVCSNVHCVRLGDYKSINSCHAFPERHDRLHVAPWPIIVAVLDMRDVTRKYAPADYFYYWQAVVGGKQKIKLTGLSVRTLWSITDAAPVVIHYDTLREINQLLAPDAHWLFTRPPDALRLPSRAVIRLVSCSLTPEIGLHF